MELLIAGVGLVGQCQMLTEITFGKRRVEYKKEHLMNLNSQQIIGEYKKNLFSGLPCVISQFGYTNRTLNVLGDTTLPVVCWESCGPCTSGPTSYNVTFQVDMRYVTDLFPT